MASPDYTQEALSGEGHQAKQATRVRALGLVKQSSFLWSRDHQALTCDWVELAGARAPTLQYLLEEQVLRPDLPARFIGVDHDEDVIRGCRELFGDDGPASWHQGGLAPALRREDAFPRAGVLVYDSHRSVKGDRTTLKEIDRLARFAEHQCSKLNEFMLVLNVSAHPRDVSEQDVEDYLRALSTAVGFEVPLESLHRYVSKHVPMLWTALTWGF